MQALDRGVLHSHPDRGLPRLDAPLIVLILDTVAEMRPSDSLLATCKLSLPPGLLAVPSTCSREGPREQPADTRFAPPP